MAVKLAKLTAAERKEFWKKNGRKAAKIGIKKYSHAQRVRWARTGGRPQSKRTIAILNALKGGPKSSEELSRLTKIPKVRIVEALCKLKARKGLVTNPAKGVWQLTHDATSKSKTENQNRQQKSR